jgi:hypothetical protein
VLTGARRYTDEFETLRRGRDLGLAAEIQWELLPVLAYELSLMTERPLPRAQMLPGLEARAAAHSCVPQPAPHGPEPPGPSSTE